MNGFKTHFSSNLMLDSIDFSSTEFFFFRSTITQVVLQHTSLDLIHNPVSIMSPLMAFYTVTSQYPKKLIAKNSVAAFNIREDQIIGCQVTLRHHQIHAFLTQIALIMQSHKIVPFFSIDRPSFSGTFGFNFNISDLLIFLETDKLYDFFPKSNDFGCRVHITIQATTLYSAIHLLRGYGFPIEYPITH